LNTRQGDIVHNLEVIRQRIENACVKCGRSYADIMLLLATKTVDPEGIRHAIEAGYILIGENKVQEFTTKYEALSDLIYSRHFIGHLQRNKVREVLKYADNIQTVDSLALATEIDKEMNARGKKLDIMIQVNTSFEKSKFGLHPDEVIDFMAEIRNMNHLNVMGLMTIGLFAATAEEARPSYKLLKSLGEQINEIYFERPIHHYSMGMSGDLEVAIEEGATIVRVGSAVFGPRIYV